MELSKQRSSKKLRKLYVVDYTVTVSAWSINKIKIMKETNILYSNYL